MEILYSTNKINNKYEKNNIKVAQIKKYNQNKFLNKSDKSEKKKKKWKSEKFLHKLTKENNNIE